MKHFNLILILSFTFCNTSLFAQKKGSKRSEVIQTMKLVADWQINNFNYATSGTGGYLHDYGIDAWTNATLFLGFSEWAKIAPDNLVYYNWLKEIGDTNQWKIPANFASHAKYSLYHADELCIGQFYLAMYEKYKDQSMIDSTLERTQWILNNPPNPDMNFRNKQSWTWCDALFMAPQVYLHIGIIKEDSKYIEFMDTEFMKTYNHLFDKEHNLFFRDDSYFEKREENGAKIFWGRGNGWVVGGLVNILKLLPNNYPKHSFYEELFVEIIKSLVKLQDEDGFWHASLLDPESYPSPETSATALITYGLAYGINHNLLDKNHYSSFAHKGWNALCSAIDEDGKLGYVQPIGADPKKVTKDMTAVYGVGAFLLAGTEMINLAKK